MSPSSVLGVGLAPVLLIFGLYHYIYGAPIREGESYAPPSEVKITGARCG
jgi:hypothetical protein